MKNFQKTINPPISGAMHNIHSSWLTLNFGARPAADKNFYLRLMVAKMCASAVFTDTYIFTDLYIFTAMLL